MKLKDLDNSYQLWTQLSFRNKAIAVLVIVLTIGLATVVATSFSNATNTAWSFLFGGRSDLATQNKTTLTEHQVVHEEGYLVRRPAEIAHQTSSLTGKQFRDYSEDQLKGRKIRIRGPLADVNSLGGGVFYIDGFRTLMTMAEDQKDALLGLPKGTWVTLEGEFFHMNREEKFVSFSNSKLLAR